MTRGAPALEVDVVPDSGTGELKGLAGTLTIRIEAGGKHFYDFEYTLDPAAPPQLAPGSTSAGGALPAFARARAARNWSRQAHDGGAGVGVVAADRRDLPELRLGPQVEA